MGGLRIGPVLWLIPAVLGIRLRYKSNVTRDNALRREVGKMIRWLMVGVIALGLTSRVYAEHLIVLTDHSSVWAVSATRSGDSVTYKDKVSGKSVTVPGSTVDAIVPRAVRGQKYSPASVEAVIERLKELEKKHVAITKRLTAVRNEWSARLFVDPKLEKKIESVLTTFQSSQKDMTAYKQALFSIQMMQYKDAAGAFEAKVKATVRQLRDALLGVDLGAFEDRALASRFEKDAYKAFREEGRALLEKEMPEDIRTDITKMLDTARATILGQYVPYGMTLMKKSPGLNAYLYGRTMLFLMDAEIAETDADHALIKKEFETLKVALKKRIPGADFSYKNFVLAPNDIKSLKRTADFSSINEVENVTGLEHAYVVPKVVPRYLETKKTLSFPVTVIMERLFFEKWEYKSFVVLSKHGNPVMRLESIPGFALRSGRADVSLKFRLGGIPDGEALKDDDGNRHIFMGIAGRKVPVPGKPQTRFQPISLACKIPVGKPKSQDDGSE